MKFKHAFSPFALLMVSVGGVVGSGWLFGSMYAAQVAGVGSIISWILGGILIMIIALNFAELATMFPVAGGMVRFAEMTHGHTVGFAFGWIAWLAMVMVAPVETMAVVQYASNYIPHLMIQSGDHPSLTLVGFFAAAVLLFIVCYLNVLGARFVNKLNLVLVFIKLIIPIATVVLLLTTAFHPHNFLVTPFPSGLHGILMALPTAGIVFSFIGFGSAIQLAAEAKNPKKALPIAIIGSLLICIVLYVLLQIAFIGALDINDLARGWQNLNFVDDAGPFAGIAVGVGLVGFSYLLYADAFISPLSTGFIYTAATSRVNYGLSKNGCFPKLFSQLNKNSVPAAGIWFNFIVGLIFFLPFPGWQGMVSFFVSSYVLIYSIGPIALLSLRKRRPDYPRVFKLPYAPFMSFVAFYICNLIIYWTGFHVVYKVIILMVVGFIYFIFYHKTSAPARDSLDARSAIWLIFYLLGVLVISYLGNFGGGTQFISFGWDFLWIAVFSVVIFIWAVRSSLVVSRIVDHE